MKKKHNNKKLSKKQRRLKKYIPDGPYCEGYGVGKHPGPCPFWHALWDQHMKSPPYIHNRNECQFAKGCNDDCSQCKEDVSMCDFLNYIEYGQYPLGDMCKVCGIRIHTKEM